MSRLTGVLSLLNPLSIGANSDEHVSKGLFAMGLKRERSALNAVVRRSLSNRSVESIVHKVKLLKRQMYGRMSFPLLHARILLTALLH